MRYGVISDIHGNLEALLAVVSAMEEEAIDTYVCLGDVVGYGASPNECCELIRALCPICCVGNHDAAVSGRMDYSFYYDAAREALDWTATVIEPAHRQWLAGLPYRATRPGLSLSHGEPVRPDHFNYIFSLNQAYYLLPYIGRLEAVSLIGHSHLFRCYLYEGSGVRENTGDGEGLVVLPGRRYLISAGSVGQPRDNDPRAGYLVLDTDTGQVAFRRVEYDIDTAAGRIVRAGLFRNFALRLFSGV